MTYAEIVKQALAHLEYGTDEDAYGTFAERFTMYANDAVREIATSLKLDKVETVTLDDGTFNIDDLTEETVVKIVEVFKGNRAYPFVRGDSFGDFRVLNCKETEVSVRYRYLPEYDTDGNSEPAIPKVFHPILYLYVVHCHHNSRSTSSDYDRTKWLQLFESERSRIMKQAYGALDTYAWKNRPWETGEM